VAWFDNQMDADAIVVGAGLAGLTATAELARAGRRVLLLDQEPESNLGGQAFWSFGGLFLVGSPEQRRMGIRDSHELAWQDWMGSAFFDRGADDPAGEDYWAYRWAQAYVAFAAGEKRSWLHGMGVRWLPLVGWAERGGYLADGHGNSVPRFHVTWGTGPAVVAPFERQVRAAADAGLVGLRFRHRVDGLTVTRGTVDGVRGAILEPSRAARGTRSSRVQAGEFELHAPAVIVTSGGIGGNLDLVRATWPDRLGPAPDRMICGVPEHVDGRMLAIAERAGGRLVNRDRMWHYTEGIQNWDPIWAGHGIRILPGPSSLWFDARGRRFPAPHFPGFDTLGTLIADYDGLRDRSYWELPAGRLPAIERFGGPDIGTQRALAAPETAEHARIAGRHDAITAPSLVVTGWYDVFLQGALDNHVAMATTGRPTKLLVGPWSHVENAVPGAVGEINFGLTSTQSAIAGQYSLSELELRWFDHWLLGGTRDSWTSRRSRSS
jgi:predicted oxidoreductase